MKKVLFKLWKKYLTVGLFILSLNYTITEMVSAGKNALLCLHKIEL